MNRTEGDDDAAAAVSLELVALARRFQLPLPAVREAKEAFDFYRALDAEPQPPVVEENTGEPKADSMGEAGDAPVEQPPSVIGVAGLQAFLQDMGTAKTTTEVRALIHSLVTPPRDLAQLHAQERDARAAAASSPEGVSEQHVATPPTTTTPYASGGDHAGQEEALTLAQFLHLLRDPVLGAVKGGDVGTRGGECAALQQREAHLTFHALDADGDGAVTERDVRTVLARLLLDEAGENPSPLAANDGLLRLAAMHPTEMRTALEECDINADGLVTVEDFVALMHA